MRKRLVQKLLFAFGTYLFAFGLSSFEPAWLEPEWQKLVYYFGGLSLTLLYVERRLTKILSDQRALSLLAVITFHLFASLLLAILWRLWGPAYDIRFVLNFFVFYVAFLVFEVISLLYNLRPLSNESQ